MESANHWRAVSGRHESVGSDDLQNELILILHHVHDIEKNLKSGEVQTALQGLGDVREAVERVMSYLPSAQVRGIERATQG